MRQIGSFDNETHAVRFVDYLKTIGISAHSTKDESKWLIWVRDENDRTPAGEAWEQFVADPESQPYLEAGVRAERIRLKEIQEKRKSSANVEPASETWSLPSASNAPVTIALIVLCILVAALGGGFGTYGQLDRALSFTDLLAQPGFLTTDNIFFNISRGELWRIITPILLHADLMHVGFNLYWLFFLGSQIESRIGSPKFAVLALATAAIPNLLQAMLSGPNFLGISGVVYGLLAYMWIRRGDGYLISQQTMVIVMIFFVLGFTPQFNHAVWAHGGGLLVGGAIGYFPEFLHRR